MKKAKVAIIIYLLMCKNNLYYDFAKNHREKNKREEFKYQGDEIDIGLSAFALTGLKHLAGKF